jgi:CheY-like chemotaxis protein
MAQQGPTNTGRFKQPAGGLGPGTFPQHRILVVDDNRDTVDSEALLLQMLGQTVQRAYDGASALRLAAEFQPQIVLLDLDMPGMSGLEVARQLRRMPIMKDVKVIAYTGFARPEYRAATDAAGFDDFITKPVPLTRLINLLHEI